MTDATSPAIFVRIDGIDAAAMKDIPALVPLLARYIAARTELTDYAGAIAAARDEYASDDVEIDDNPSISRADDGTWVSAWVWVPDAEPTEDEKNEAAARDACLSVRHDLRGFYILTDAEAEHEDAGNPSAGFDGREHYQMEADAWAAAAEQAEG